MKKESINAKKSTHNSKKLEETNDENNLIETKSDSENLLIATEPPRITINMVGGEKWTTNEHYPQRMRAYKITERVKGKDDLSITYRRGKILYYKAHPKAKAEILAVDGYAIWFYHEFVSDIEAEGKRHRVFYNPYAKKFFINEIISDDSNRTLLKNPSYDEDKTKRILELFNDGKTPDEQLRFTARIITKRIEKAVDEHFAKSDTKPKTKGRPAEQYLRDATFWAISNRQSKESKPKVAERAFELFEKEATSKDALKTAILRIWNEAYAKFKIEKEKMDVKNHFTFKKFAKTYLKIKQKTRKQRTKIKT
jgi:hypothetical protein